MKQYKKNFIWFEQVVEPAIKVASLPVKPVPFALGYRCVSDKEKDFLMKFKIISPTDNTEAVEITHGYLFSVREDFIIRQNLKKLADFFTFLVAESLKDVNQSLGKGEIQIPSRKSLLNSIHKMLQSEMN